jgi:hypothetical protein
MFGKLFSDDVWSAGGNLFAHLLELNILAANSADNPPVKTEHR